ncbi:MAG TPA: riboflavin synthase [Casimicrobiaceae bacterium]
MFTGIVRAVGMTTACRPVGDGARIVVAVTSGALGDAPVSDPRASDLRASDPRIGDSIAVNGCCLTVVGVTNAGVTSAAVTGAAVTGAASAATGVELEFDVSAETLARTTGFPAGRRVNLESALRLSDRLDGHLVSGHVDATGVVSRFREIPGGGGSVALAVAVPAAIARFVAAKGSIAVDGVSLTTNTVVDAPNGGARFTVNLIPHTLTATTLGSLSEGAAVNLEVDLVARYLDRLRRADEPQT